MGHEFSIDVTELHMFSGYEWVDLGEACAHECEHRGTSVIGWGPDMAHYELVDCDHCGCRAWIDGREQRERDHGGPSPSFWRGRTEWRQV